MAPNTHQGSSLLVFLCLAGAMALWGSAFIAIKIALNDIPPFALIFLRLILGSVFFLAFWRVSFREVVASKDRWLLLLMSIFEPCLYFLFETKALMYTTASQAGVVFAFLPILILVFSYILHREKPSFAQVIGGVIAVIGVVILCLSGSPSADASSPAFGNFLELLAMASAAVYTVLLKRLSGTYSPFFLAAVQSFTGAIFFLPFGIYDFAQGVTIGATSAIAVIYLGLIVTAGAYTLFNVGISKTSVAQGAMYFNLVPIFTIIFSMAFLGETISLAQLASMALVVLGVLLGLAPSRQRAIEAA
ncbi:DMT family transporter [Ectopseudomonas oleovorans]|uniref:DMT family transporter n=1 Tax=Ectopseudomonas oleovorans TaxID=301 RepID=A0AB35L3B8_ECTOL|nr:DMT family transporter [Pseudomonas oleovorans]MCR1829101.1 DMT family transporter [Pseudomonas oleovorans]MDH0569529.1 DMT family transporter [Pseudomonas oleovorans]MDH2200911.1 DMT family transporter [Pseudomonas oleovorans]